MLTKKSFGELSIFSQQRELEFNTDADTDADVISAIYGSLQHSPENVIATCFKMWAE